MVIDDDDDVVVVVVLLFLSEVVVVDHRDDVSELSGRERRTAMLLNPITPTSTHNILAWYAYTALCGNLIPEHLVGPTMAIALEALELGPSSRAFEAYPVINITREHHMLGETLTLAVCPSVAGQLETALFGSCPSWSNTISDGCLLVP